MAFSIALLLLFAWWMIPARWVRHDPHALRVWVLAVGDGSGTVIELPDGRVMLYDFGTRSNLDPARTAVSFLKHRAIDRIDTAFVSHSDFDHYSAIARLAMGIPIRRVVVNDQFERFVEPTGAAAQFLAAIRAMNIPIETISGPTVIDETAGVRIEAIWPPALASRKLSNSNDASLVLRVTFGNQSVLLTGDIVEAGLAGLLAQGNLRADALLLPHHGSVVRDTARFVAAVDPQVAVRSTGQRHVLTTNGIAKTVGKRRYYSTADDGCVLLELQNGELMARSMREGL